MYRLLLSGAAACLGLQQEICEQRLMIHVLLGRFHSCKLWDFRYALRLRPGTGLQQWPMVRGCRGCVDRGLGRLAL